MKEIGSMIKNMDMAKKALMMDQNTWETSEMDFITVLAFTHSKTALFTKGIGSTTKDKALASIPV